MAYVNYEILPARKIHNRAIPRLYKLYRSDNTYDLFMLSSLQPNYIQYLHNTGQAGVFAGRKNDSNAISVSTWSVQSWSGTNFSYFGIYCVDGTRYASVPHCAINLRLDNSIGLYPYIIRGRSRSDHAAGARVVRVYNGSSWTTLASGSNNWGEGTIWSFDITNLSTILDWKQYTNINVLFRAVDGSKFTGAQAWLKMNFVHRFSESSTIYRFYR